MIFAWDETNRDHIAKHGVTPPEAEQVIRGASPPFPRTADADKWIVWGPTDTGRFLQVIYVHKSPDDIEYNSLTVEDWLEVQAGRLTRVVRLIHAMDLTARMMHQLRRQQRRK